MEYQLVLPAQISRFDGYKTQILTHNHKQAAIQLVSQEFSKKEHLSLAYFKTFGGSSLDNWRSYWQEIMKELLDSGLSVGCFDQKTNELVATLFCKEMTPILQNKQLKLEKSDFKSTFKGLGRHLLNNLPQAYKDILNGSDGKVVVFRGVALKDNHMSKYTFPMMTFCVEYLASKKGYNYIHAWTSNGKAANGLTKLGYTNISQFDASQFSFNGLRVFSQINEKHRNQGLWLKRIRKTKSVQAKL